MEIFCNMKPLKDLQDRHCFRFEPTTTEAHVQRRSHTGMDARRGSFGVTYERNMHLPFLHWATQ